MNMMDLKRHLYSEKVITLQVKVRPNAQTTRLRATLDDGTLKIDIKAAPEDGKANEELIAYLSYEFDVPKTNIELISGQTSRKKVVRIRS